MKNQLKSVFLAGRNKLAILAAALVGAFVASAPASAAAFVGDDFSTGFVAAIADHSQLVVIGGAMLTLIGAIVLYRMCRKTTG